MIGRGVAVGWGRPEDIRLVGPRRLPLGACEEASAAFFFFALSYSSLRGICTASSHGIFLLHRSPLLSSPLPFVLPPEISSC
jgi:hypothetical protein